MSNHFPDCYLRGDGSGLRDWNGGKVNLQTWMGSYEKWVIVENPDGTTSFESQAFPGCFLRLDRRGVDSPTDDGPGTVN
ncbi:unnamed protein product, partial [Discosporangium mesarthrocarpum]